ncbi:hypothetical protein [Legionella drozanskii]|uniref:Uncharacterized protein n=2 Tax=Legionella TaxID=445 RepID=A0A0W0SWU0_9GAMM|nr:hypothetical protein [Legionella drozanskii]KTC87724.1 hypothetical protein Ldro_1343 [Legionella drozanskii LLAP-1]
MPVTIKTLLEDLNDNNEEEKQLKTYIENLKLKGTRVIQTDLNDIKANLSLVNKALQLYDDSKELNQDSLIGILTKTNPQHVDGMAKLKQLEKLYELMQGPKKKNFAGISRKSFLTMNLNQLQTSFKIFDNLPDDKTLTQNAFDLIIKSPATANLSDEQQTHLSNTINTMLNSNIPLSSNVPLASRLFKQNIQRFLDLDKQYWKGAQTLLDALATHDALDSRTFDYIMDKKNAKYLSRNVEEIVKIFEHMENFGVPIKGNRQFIMNIDANFKGVNQLFSALKNKGFKLNQDSFKLLSEYADYIKESQVGLLSDCMEIMQHNGISFIKDDEARFLQLLQLTDEQLQGVKDILSSLSEADKNEEGYLDARTFDYVTKNAGNLEAKAGLVADVFKAMGNVGIPIIKNRQPVMSMGIQAATDPNAEKALKNLALVLNQITATPNKPPLDRDAFDVLRKNISSEDYTEEQAKALGECINLMNKQGFPLTQTFGKDTLKTLLQKKAHLPILVSILKVFPPDKLDEKSFAAILNSVENFDTKNLEHLTTCIAAMAQNNIPLTQTLGRDKLAKLLALGVNLPHVAQVLAHFQTANEGELNESTFDYIVDNADELELDVKVELNDKEVTKAELIKLVFDQMKTLDISTVGHRKPIINLSATQLKTLYEVLAKIEDKPLDKDFLKVLRDPNNLKEFNPDNTENLSYCIAAMARNNIPLTQTLGKNKLSMLLTLDTKDLANVATVLAAFKENELDKDTFDYLVKNAGALDLGMSIDAETGPLNDPSTENITKAVLIEIIFAEMRDRDISIPDNSQALIKLPIAQLNTLNSVLRHLTGPLDPASFKVLRDNLGKFNAANTASLSQCISAMTANNIPLTQMIGKDKLAVLLKLDDKDLVNVAELLSSFKEGELDEKTFNYIVDNVKSLATIHLESNKTKASLIVDVFKAMQQLGIPTPGNRQPVMKLDPTQLHNLHSVLDNLLNQATPLKLNPSSFKVLLDNISQFNPVNSNALNSIIQTLTQNGVSLGKTIGEDRLKSLVKAGNLEDIERLFKAFNKDDKLDNRTVDYIIDNASKFNKDKVDAIINVFDAMRDLQMKLPGNRQPVMNLAVPQLKALTDILKNLKEDDLSLSNDDFKEILNNINKLKTAPVPLTNCLKALIKSEIPLSQNKMNRLMKLKDPQLAAIEKLLGTLAEHDQLDSRTFDYIVDNAEQLKDKADLLQTIFDTMAVNSIPIAGNRQPLMKLNVKQLETFNNFLKENLDLINKHTIGGIINKAKNGTLHTQLDSSNKHNLGTEVDEDKDSSYSSRMGQR